MSHTFFEEISGARAVSEPKPGTYVLAGKRVLDIVATILVIPIVLPIIFICWFCIVARGGSGFYRQPRVGRDGRIFQCWKIRTMGEHADRKLAELLASDPKLAKEWQATQKLKHDPRITRFGRFLRSSSIDELPQFWNVLIGQMSLIGPRPFTPNQQKLYDALSPGAAYYRLRPGISGLWQVQSRNTGEFKDRVGYDEDYARRVTFIGDLKIVWRTVVVVLRATGS